MRRGKLLLTPVPPESEPETIHEGEGSPDPGAFSNGSVMSIGPVHINVVYNPLMPEADTDRRKVFRDEDYRIEYDEPFEEVARELIDLSTRLINLLPDPSLSPNERLERLARVVPKSLLVTAHRRNARSKLVELRRRLDELVPDPDLSYPEKLEWLVSRLDELVPGDMRPIEKLEKLGDYRAADVGVSPRSWQ
ncbi:hypothetical protein [Streptomyces megasporus]|uniref:hypothetical protein n=1 Tax=Streptomyces megasporus TaxID=44060 RepID=UPI001B80BD60|nr:hypothetical protein [Streptomyces megasporus]